MQVQQQHVLILNIKMKKVKVHVKHVKQDILAQQHQEHYEDLIKVLLVSTVQEVLMPLYHDQQEQSLT